MEEKYTEIIDKFNQTKVLVIGESVLDSYLKGVSDRVCKEAPVPIVDMLGYENFAGGAANTAVNVAALGAEVFFISVTGDDEEGRILKEILEKKTINCSNLILDRRRITLTKKRVISSGQMLVRLDNGSTGSISEQAEQKIIAYLLSNYRYFDVVIISDYSYGILTEKVRNTIQKLQNIYDKVLAIDAKQLDLYRDFNASLVKPNYFEAAKLLKLKNELLQADRVRQLIKYKSRILEITKAKYIIISLDTEGSLTFKRDGTVYRTYAKLVKDSKAVGAGDTYTAGASLALSVGAGVEQSAEIASAASSLVVLNEGTVYCSKQQLKNFFLQSSKYLSDWKKLREVTHAFKLLGKRIVFTNGCFDILHSGHVNYLNKAKSLGDILIVGINSDESVRTIKGKNRPVNKLKERLEVLGGLSSVDYLTSFTDLTPVNLIKWLKPDIYVKGSDYIKKTLPETPIVESYGGKVTIVGFKAGQSTTGIINKIRLKYPPLRL